MRANLFATTCFSWAALGALGAGKRTSRPHSPIFASGHNFFVSMVLELCVLGPMPVALFSCRSCRLSLLVKVPLLASATSADGDPIIQRISYFPCFGGGGGGGGEKKVTTSLRDLSPLL